VELSQEGYPSPDELDNKGHKKYKNYEEMLPEYTFACGGSDKIAKIIRFLNSQSDTVDEIRARQKEEREEPPI